MLTPYYPGGYRDENDPGEPTTGLPRVSITDQEAELFHPTRYGLASRQA